MSAHQGIDAFFAGMEIWLGTDALAMAGAFAAAFLILLREGLEAALVLAGLFTFASKIGRRDALRWVHAGWIAAAVAAAATGFVAAAFIDLTAGSELTDAITALLAAVLLLYFGWWLHGKAYAEAWDRFLRGRLGKALGAKTLWALAGASFLAVYRELLELALFYHVLWMKTPVGAQVSVPLGMVAAAVVLSVVACAIPKYGRRLPIGPFFQATSILFAALGMVYLGDGVASLQHAGVLDRTAIDALSLPVLGLQPSMEVLAAVAVVAVATIFGFRRARSRARFERAASAVGLLPRS